MRQPTSVLLLVLEARSYFKTRGIGKSFTDDEYETYVKELEVFRNWFDQNVLTMDPETLSDATMVMPYGSAKPKYRDSPNE